MAKMMHKYLKLHSLSLEDLGLSYAIGLSMLVVGWLIKKIFPSDMDKAPGFEIEFEAGFQFSTQVIPLQLPS